MCSDCCIAAVLVDWPDSGAAGGGVPSPCRPLTPSCTPPAVALNLTAAAALSFLPSTYYPLSLFPSFSLSNSSPAYHVCFAPLCLSFSQQITGRLSPLCGLCDTDHLWLFVSPDIKHRDSLWLMIILFVSRYSVSNLSRDNGDRWVLFL